ncbi:conserved hypothetical protein [Mucor ambiguus]|uniref:Reverse transcriptase domain-containing protein n=1 Tax=Mucor ambiguus TaxID=91626 RepID=A0A0C9MD55_9FUNG|nr:conserved hypothetical protein [Mucor ambiguus]
MRNNIKNKITDLQIGSINCRSLSKSSNIPRSQSFSRHLTTQHLDIICLQETQEAHSDTIQQRLDMQLKAQQSIWSSHCGIVSLNPQVHITSLYVSSDDRVILCKVSHPNNVFPSFTIMNIYASATNFQRYAFYATLLQLVYFQSILTNMNTGNPLPSQHPDIVVGDFNYNFTQFPAHSITDYSPPALEFLSSSYASQVLTETSLDPDSHFVMPQLDQHTTPPVCSQWIWHGLLLHHYSEVSHKLNTDPTTPTFRREFTSTTIDYIFISPDLAPFVTKSDIQFISSTWTDHALLRFDLRFTSTTHGTGIWKANLYLVQNEYFITQLHTALDEFHSNLASFTVPPPVQISWDEIKILTINIVKKISRHKACWCTRHLILLQKKRNKLIKSYQGQAYIATQILKVERLINNLQEELVEVATLRSGLRWREKGEKSAGLMKRLITQRTIRRSIETLQHTDTNVICTQPSDLQSAARRYYEILYTPTPVDPSNVTYFTNQTPQSDRLSDSSHGPLCAPFSPEDLIDGASRSPNKNSPGMDSLPYEVLALLFQHPASLKLALQVFDKALSTGAFPATWQETCLILLPKKGDLSQLKNWRPISVINTDAKIFTRVINHRLMIQLGTKLCTNQMGFMPQRFIGEQGMIVQCMQEIATKTGSPAIALLLDQEKAYDQVHLDYLRACMAAFNIPSTLITAVTPYSHPQLVQ